MVTNYDGERVEIPEVLPMLPVRDIVVFPYMIIPLFVGRDSSILSVEESLARSDRLILLSSQKDISDEHPSPEGIYEVGTVAMIMRMRKLPDGRIKILTQGLCKAKIEDFKLLALLLCSVAVYKAKLSASHSTNFLMQAARGAARVMVNPSSLNGLVGFFLHLFHKDT